MPVNAPVMRTTDWDFTPMKYIWYSRSRPATLRRAREMMESQASSAILPSPMAQSATQVLARRFSMMQELTKAGVLGQTSFKRVKHALECGDVSPLFKARTRQIGRASCRERVEMT